MKTNRRFIAGLILLCAASLAMGCRFEYGDNLEVDELDQDIPDIKSTQSVFEIYRDDKLALALDAESMSIFSKAGRREFKKVNFIQYNSKGEKVAEGSADSAVYYIQGERTEFSGKLDVNLIKEDARIKTEYLIWDQKKGTLEGKPDVLVDVRKNDGSQFSGYNLFVDLNKRVMELDGGLSGAIYSSEE